MQNLNSTSYNIEVGERIRSIRKSYNMNREKFSEIIDISEVFLGQIERGERSLSLKTLRKIIAFSGYSADFILFGKVDNNNKLEKIHKLLTNCSEKNLDYIYDIILLSKKLF